MAPLWHSEKHKDLTLDLMEDTVWYLSTTLFYFSVGPQEQPLWFMKIDSGLYACTIWCEQTCTGLSYTKMEAEQILIPEMQTRIEVYAGNYLKKLGFKVSLGESYSLILTLWS